MVVVVLDVNVTDHRSQITDHRSQITDKSFFSASLRLWKTVLQAKKFGIFNCTIQLLALSEFKQTLGIPTKFPPCRRERTMRESV